MFSRVCRGLRMTQPNASNPGLLFAHGDTVPTDTAIGYATGCLFQHTDGTAGSALYVNEGDIDSCDFNLVESTDALTIASLVDVADAFATRLLETGTYASEVSKGVTLSATNVRPFSLLYDDAGAALGSDVYRGMLSRIYLGHDQSECTIIANRGQLKLADGVDLATGVYAPVQGYIELAATHEVSSGAKVSCVDASLEIGTALTVASGGQAAGVHVETTGSGTITNSGTCAGVLIDMASGAAKWPDGILIDGPSVIKGIRVGKFAGSAATTSAVTFGTAQNVYSDGQLSTLEVHGSSASNLTSAYAAHCGRFRHIVNVGTGNVEHETYGLIGQCVVKDSTLKHEHAGVMGTFEGHTSGVVVNGAYQYGIGAVNARVGGGAYITATKDIAGFCAFWNGAALAGGESVALAIGDTGGVGVWTHAIGIERCTNLLDLPAAGTDPVIANALVPSAAPTAETVGADAALRVLVNNVAYYIALYDTLHG